MVAQRPQRARRRHIHGGAIGTRWPLLHPVASPNLCVDRAATPAPRCRTRATTRPDVVSVAIGVSASQQRTADRPPTGRSLGPGGVVVQSRASARRPDRASLTLTLAGTDRA